MATKKATKRTAKKATPKKTVPKKAANAGVIPSEMVTTFSRPGDAKLAPIDYDEVNRQIRAVARMPAEGAGELLLRKLVKAGKRAQRTLRAAGKKKAAKKK